MPCLETRLFNQHCKQLSCNLTQSFFCSFQLSYVCCFWRNIWRFLISKSESICLNLNLNDALLQPSIGAVKADDRQMTVRNIIIYCFDSSGVEVLEQRLGGHCWHIRPAEGWGPVVALGLDHNSYAGFVTTGDHPDLDSRRLWDAWLDFLQAAEAEPWQSG